MPRVLVLVISLPITRSSYLALTHIILSLQRLPGTSAPEVLQDICDGDIAQRRRDARAQDVISSGAGEGSSPEMSEPLISAIPTVHIPKLRGILPTIERFN